nr:MAG TPA: holin protein [Caudoviricetes sp.]
MDWSVITLLTSFITACMSGGIIYRQITRNKRQDAMLLAIGQYRLIKSCEQYLARGCITVQELTSLEMLYSAYHGLGGNGVVSELYIKCKKLSVK